MYKTILLAVDLGDESSWQKALPVALATTRAFGSALHVMTVVPDFGMSIVGSFFPPGYEKEAMDQASKALHDFVRENVPKDVKVVHDVGHGVVYEEILASAARVGADLIVMAAHRPEQSDYLLGPNAARVARHATCSVLVVR